MAVTVSLCLMLGTQAACNPFGAPNAARREPIPGILDAFRTHQIVALGEGAHNNNQSHAFRLALIRDPRLPFVVNDIVVEFGSARYQGVMDRFVRGGDVPYAELRKAWQDTTAAHPLWDVPIYEEFFRAVRAVNASLPSDRQLRVLLAGPPINWDAVTTHEDIMRWMEKGDPLARDMIAREVLSRNRRALVVYGDGHFLRHGRLRGMEGPAPTLLNLIEATGVSVFSIWTNTTVQLERMQRDVASWPVPSLTVVRGTRLGTLDFKYFGGVETAPPSRMEEQFDAVLYLGPVSSITFSELPAALCADDDYTRMRLARVSFAPSGVDVAEFRKQCGPYLRPGRK
jgi:hypothetical protein